SGAATGVAFSDDGSRLGATGDEASRVYDSASGRVVRSFEDRGRSQCGFRADGQAMGSVGEGPARVWDLRTGELLLELGPAGGRAVGFSMTDDNAHAAALDADGNLHLGGPGLPVQSVRGVGDVKFSRDDRHCFTAFTDGRVTRSPVGSDPQSGD